MIPEPALIEMLEWSFINSLSSLIGSQIHKTLYYTLGLTFWAMHFLHYFFPFLLLFLLGIFGIIKLEWISLKITFPLALTEALTSFSACIIHHGGSDGAVHSIRSMDGLVTILVIFLSRIFLETSARLDSKSRLLMIIIGISSSLAWLETIIYVNKSVISIWPVLIISNALHVVLTFQTYQRLKLPFTTLALHICGMTGLFTFPFAMSLTSDSFNKDSHQVGNSWETVDYVLIVVAFAFMTGMLVSKYWLVCNCRPETYLVIRHSKYLLASFGQWFLQNMANITIFSILGKFGATVFLSLYFYKRWKFSKVKPNRIITNT